MPNYNAQKQLQLDTLADATKNLYSDSGNQTCITWGHRLNY